MTRFFCGLGLGLFMGVSLSAYAATIVGNTPTLTGWTVTAGDRTVCSDPEVDFTAKEIDCGDDIDPRDFMDRPDPL